MRCPHDDGHFDRYVRCRHLSSNGTVTMSVAEAICDQCMRAGENEKPISKTGTPLLFSIMKGSLAARLHCLDLPRCQDVDPIDVDRAFARYLEIADDSEDRDLLKETIRMTALVAEDDGGLPPDQLAGRLVRLADHFNMTDVVEEFINDYSAARTRLSDGDAG